MDLVLQGFSDARKDILVAIKRHGPQSIGELSRSVGVTREAIRQHLAQLERDGWVSREVDRGHRRPGRPPGLFHLTAAGDHLFLKHYDALAVELADTVSAELGADSLVRVLAALTDVRVRRWAPVLAGLPLRERLETLRGLYLDEDPYTRVEEGADGDLRLVERNCPFLEVARQRPALCSVTVSTLSRLLGCRVVREERFQSGDGCCTFRVLADQPLPEDTPPFFWEPEDP